MRISSIATRISILLIAVVFEANVSSASSETLETILSNTYLSNPEIKAERARVRALDEEMPRARSGFRPKFNLNGDITGQRTRSKPELPSDEHRRSGGYTISMVQPLFRGLRTLNSIRQVDGQIYSARESLRNTEQSIFLRAVTAYVDVMRDRAILRLRSSNVDVLAQQLQATRDRFNVGEVTKTDVAQARARHSGAISQLNLAKATLKTSRAVFEQVAGINPNGLRRPRSIARYLPRTLQASLDRGMQEHPSILAAAYLEMSASYTIDRIRGELLPEINLEGSVTRRYHPATGTDRRSTAIIKGTFNMPLYEGGEVYARVRQAKQTVLQRRQELETARKLVRANVITSWGQVTSTEAKLEADKSQVSANKTALDGVREEEKVGQRTVLNVLDAQQEYLDSQVTLLITRRDLIVAKYSLLASTGRLTAAELGLKVAHYAPEEHYQKVKRKWIGTRVEEYSDDFEHRALVNDRYFPENFK